MPVTTDNSTTAMVGYSIYEKNKLPISVNCLDDKLIIEWDDGAQSEYHYLWLRDNCHCEQCITSLTREQIFEICDVPFTIKPSNANISPEHELQITWDFENHHSRYLAGWLEQHCYTKASREARQLKPTLWDRQQISQYLPTHQYQDIMSDSQALLNWLYEVRDYGISIVKNVDTSENTVKKVAERISFIRETNFGTIFDVVAKNNANSAAYTTLRLPLHTDLPTRELQPGLQFLHCLVNDAQGGESILVDGFKIAQYIRENYPDDFIALTTLSMSFYNKDKASDYRFDSPAISVNNQGEVVEVRLANFLRGPIAIAADKMQAIYAGYRRFMLLARQERFQFFHRLNAGDLLVFDNRRVLHSRNAFSLEQGHRHLQGCYVDRDELLSRIRVLERELA
ncbi:TauD/TfdA family dioxygenase [Gammaproteobacteria bacterium AS21]|jgi:gamma-butyrobetaine dioxygenase